jgi:hypothetical protein
MDELRLQTLCDICQKLTETKVIGGNTVCRQEITEAEWEQGKLYTDPSFGVHNMDAIEEAALVETREVKELWRKFRGIGGTHG